MTVGTRYNFYDKDFGFSIEVPLSEIYTLKLFDHERFNQRLGLLFNMTQEMNDSESDQEMFDIVMGYACKILQTDRASIAIINETRTHFEFMAVHGVEGSQSKSILVPVDGSAVGATYKKEIVCYRPNIAESSCPVLTSLYVNGINSTMVASIVSAGVSFGTFNIGSFKEDGYNTDDIILFSHLTAILATHLLNLELKYTSMKQQEILLQKNDELDRLNFSLEERVQTEVQKNRQHQKLMIQQSRHAQMGEVISMIAHQWRHPLNNLSLIIQDTIFQYKLNKLDDDAISTLSIESSSQIKQMSNTIKEFRTFFQPDNIRVKYDINRSIADAVNIVKPMLESENIVLDVRTEESIYVEGFPTELGQGIVNIMMNAKDALIENSIVDKAIKLSLSLIENDAVIIIEDNGGGVPRDIIEKIFDPYFSTKKDKNGTGLGLYITKLIVEEHMHGKLMISNCNNGFVVKIVIPKTVI